MDKYPKNSIKIDKIQVTKSMFYVFKPFDIILFGAKIYILYFLLIFSLSEANQFIQ